MSRATKSEAKKSPPKARKGGLKKQSSEQIMREFLRMKPLFSMGKILEAESLETKLGQNRRVALAIGTKTGKELRDMMLENKDDPEHKETLAGILFSIKEASKRAEAVHEIVSTCETRFRLALCYCEDMQEILEIERRMAEKAGVYRDSQ